MAFSDKKTYLRLALLSALLLALPVALTYRPKWKPLAMAPLPRPADLPKLVITPGALDLRGARQEHGILVTATFPDGRHFDVTDHCGFFPSQSGVVALKAPGQLVSLADGSTEIAVNYLGATASLKINVTDSDKVAKPSFKQDVLPVLTKAGCNAGACHGKIAGKNGFKLSLRGYAPEADIDCLTDLWSRRINYVEPDESLIISKPLAKVAHEGGQRLTENSREHRILREWIEARTPKPDAAELDAERLEVLPGHRTLAVNQRQQLLARAHYKDGRVRDVTFLAQFFSNDQSTVRVSNSGLIEALRPGETPVRVHFQTHVEIVMITTPYPNAVATPTYPAPANAIDEHVFAQLKQLSIPASPLIDDHAFIRRVFIDTIGTLPTAAEIRDFTADASPTKRQKLIDSLFERPEFADYWALQIGDIMQNRKERDHDVRGARGVRAFHAWLRNQVAINRPWNELAREVITATGDSFNNPAVGYYIVTVGEKNRAEESEAGESIAQSFLGTRIGCAKCHNHPLEKFTQDDFYHFSAFFSKIQMKRENASTATVLSVGTNDEKEQHKRVAEAEKALAEANKQAEGKTGDEAVKAKKKVDEQTKKIADAKTQLEKLKKQPPMVTQPRTSKKLGPQALDRTAFDCAGQDPRQKLAEWVTNPKNEYFTGNIVNRIWKHYFAVALVENVDDLRSSNPPSNPKLWKALNDELVAGKYDLRHLMRMILNSSTYQLSSTTLPENATDRRFYSHYYTRRLGAEVLLDAIASATAMPDQFPGYPVGLRAIQFAEPGINSYFMSLFGRSERVTACACERSNDVTLSQLLHLRNGEDILKKIGAPESRMGKLLADKKADDAQVIQEIFYATVSRPPSEGELAAVKGSLAMGDPRDEVFRDLLWALLNAKDFAFNH